MQNGNKRGIMIGKNGKTVMIYLLSSCIFLVPVLSKGTVEITSVGFYIGCLFILFYSKDLFAFHFYFLIIALNMYLMYVPLKYMHGITVTALINVYFIFCLGLQIVRHKCYLNFRIDKDMGTYFGFCVLSLGIYALNAYINETGMINMLWRMTPLYGSASLMILLYDKPEYINNFLISVIVAAVLYTAVAYYELIVGSTFFYHLWTGGERYRNGILRVGSTLGDPNTLAMYIVPTCFLLLTDYVKRIIGNRLSKVLFILMLLMVLLSGSRTSLLAFILGCAVWCLVNFKRKAKKIALAGIIGVTAVVPYVITKFFSMDFASSSQRFMLVSMAVTMWKSAPIFGIGMDNFLNITDWMTMNEYAKQLVEFGLFGILVFLYFFAIQIGYFWRNSRNSKVDRHDATYMIAALAAFAVNSVSMDSYFHYIMWILPALSLLFCTELLKNRQMKM